MSDANRQKESVMTSQEMETEFDTSGFSSAVRLSPKRSAILYTGKMPPDTAIML